MRLTLPIAGLATGVLIAGCGGGNATADVKAKVHEFAEATASRNYEKICDDILAPSLLAHLTGGGIRCEQAMEIALGHVTSPRLVLGNVTISGARATVLTLSQAVGEKTLLTAIKLVDTSNGWRISALGSPVEPGSS
jgi:hypothetical protein